MGQKRKAKQLSEGYSAKLQESNSPETKGVMSVDTIRDERVYTPRLASYQLTIKLEYVGCRVWCGGGYS